MSFTLKESLPRGCVESLRTTMVLHYKALRLVYDPCRLVYGELSPMECPISGTCIRVIQASRSECCNLLMFVTENVDHGGLWSPYALRNHHVLHFRLPSLALYVAPLSASHELRPRHCFTAYIWNEAIQSFKS